MKVRMYGNSDIGRVRKNNEDSIFFDERLPLSLVCDGIGGREGGEVASQLAMQTMRDDALAWKKKGGNPSSFLWETLARINTAIIEKGTENEKLEGMGTTMECLLIHEKELYLGHIGDSRTYLFFQNQFWQLTIDHNVRTLMSYGELPKELGVLANEDSLVKALGVAAMVVPDIYKMSIKPGLTFLSASDGLFDMVEDAQIAETMKKNKGETLVRKLIDLACKNGGNDNVSLVVTYVD